MFKDYTVGQSSYEVVGKLPIRSIILGHLGSSKTVLLQNMILDIYKGCFERFYIFSPSIDVDSPWLPVQTYFEKEMKVKQADEKPINFDHYDPDSLHEILDTQHNITQFMKNRGAMRMFQMLIMIGDFADDPAFTRQS